jgi:hypothetical protein
MKNIVKSSKKLDKLLTDIFLLYEDLNDDDVDIIGEIEADCFAMTNEDKCRVDHFDSHIRDGINLVQLSLQWGEPIYCAMPDNDDFIFYFVGDLSAIKKHLSDKLKELDKKMNKEDENLIGKLEAQIKQLKKKKK